MSKKSLIILHGENLIASRDKLVQLISEARKKDCSIVQLDALKLSPAILEQALESKTLFGEKKLIVVEGLHSLPPSKKKRSLIQLLATIKSETESFSLVLWEKRTLTKTMLKQFSNAKIEEYKLSKLIWQFLDGLGKNEINLKDQLTLLHQVLAQEDTHFIFLMIIRQVRLLIKAKEGNFSGAPFMMTKLKKQSLYFSLPQLLQLHEQLFFIDARLKESRNLLDLKSELDLWLVGLYK